MRSALVPNLDFAILGRYALRDDTLQAVRDFESEIGR